MGSWIQRAPMPTPRHDLQSVAVGNKIFAMGGALLHKDRPGHKWFDEMVEFIP